MNFIYRGHCNNNAYNLYISDSGDFWIFEDTLVLSNIKEKREEFFAWLRDIKEWKNYTQECVL